MNLFDAIKSKSLEQVKSLISPENINEKDNFGRTPLIFSVVHHAPIEIIDILLENGADPHLKDKKKENVLYKAISFERNDIKELLDKKGIKVFNARNKWGVIRTKLTSEERQIIDDLIYSEYEEQMENLHKLNSSVLLHAFVCDFNWDSEITPIELIFDNPNCKEITAKEIYDLAECDYCLKNYDSSDDYEKRYIELCKKIKEKYPNIDEPIICE